MWLFLVLPFHGFSIPICWLVQGFETFPTLPTKPSEIVFFTAVTAFENGNNGKFETFCWGDRILLWYRLVLILPTFNRVFFSLEDMLFQTFIFRSTRPWLGSMRSLLSLLNHWFCCKFTFLEYLLFSQKKWIRERGGAKLEDFHKIMTNLPPDFFLFSLDKSYLVQPLRIVGICVVLCVYFVTLSILLFLSLVLFCISPKNIVPFNFEVRFRLSRLDFFRDTFFCESEKRRLLLVHKILLDCSAGLADDRVCGFCGEDFELNTESLSWR